MSEELIQEPAQAPQMTPEEYAQKLSASIKEQQILLDEHRTNLLNVYSVVVKELRAEIFEAAQELKRPNEKLFNRDTIIQNLNTIEAEENIIFRVQNLLLWGQKKLESMQSQ